MHMSGGQGRIRKNPQLVSIIKFLVVLMIIYEGWYLQKYNAIPLLLQGLAALIIVLTVVLLIMNTSCKINKLIVYWVIFGVYSLLAAIVVRANMSIVTDSIFTYLAFVAVIGCGGIVAKYTEDYSWFSKAVLLVSVLSAYFALFHAAPYKNGSYFVTTMGWRNNPNNLGLVMGIGTFILLFPERRVTKLGWVVRVFLAFVFFMVTVNTGSRSALVCDLAVIGMFIYSRLRTLKGTRADRLIKKALLIFAVLVVAVVAINMISAGNFSTSGIRRLLDKFNAKSFSGRTDLYDTAWEMYFEHPVFGIGYNCFASTSGYGYFTHSTYMELLACTGTIGFLLFLGPVFSGTLRGLRAFNRDGGRSATILLLILVSGFFGIVYYNMVFLMVLYMEISRIPPRGAK